MKFVANTPIPYKEDRKMDILNWFKGLENALDAASLRQQVIASNIANAGTPGFKGQAVSFEQEIQKALAAQDDDLYIAPVSLDEDPKSNGKGKPPNPSDVAKPKVYDTGQPVDMNMEMVNLAKNQMMYNMLAERIGGDIGGTTKCIDEVTGR
jgi:flagellar basal-body rod protein FlgB